MKKKKILVTISCALILNIAATFGQIYNADFSTEGDGFPDHITGSPPATGPASASGGIAPNNWTTSYTTIPSTDGTANEFSVNASGAIRIQDWGSSDAKWESANIDVTGINSVTIIVVGETIGSAVQNAGSEYFKYFYKLDSGTENETAVVLAGETSGTPVNYNEYTLDVSAVNTLNVGFNFQVDGANDGYEISSFKVYKGELWSGATNSVWTTDTNWFDGSAPLATSEVSIPNGITNYPTVTTAVTLNSLDIESGATLDTKNATSFSGNVTYKRNLSTTNWYLLSSPVSGETIEDIITNNTLAAGGGGNLGFAPYDNSETLVVNRWDYQLSGSTGTVVNGKGYSVKLSATNNFSFSGTINTADVPIALTQGVGSHFNLIGNPFTAFINSGTFLTEEGITTSDITSATLWLWNQSSGTYQTKVAADSFKIAPGQGFFVEANSINDVIFTEAMQSHEATDTFQRSSNSRSEVHLFMNNKNDSRFLKIYYIDGTTTGFDNGYDGQLFGGVSNPLEIYSHLISDNQGKKYQVQSLPNSNYENMVIPVGVNAISGKELIFSAEALNLPSNLKVFLEDRETNTFIRLDEINSKYSVTLNADLNGVGRFFLHTTQSVLSTNLVDIKNISIYKSNANTLKIVGLHHGDTNVSVSNILGKIILNTNFNSTGVKEISLPKLASGVYIVKLQTEEGELNKKIVIE
jgi:hypothetical protein